MGQEEAVIIGAALALLKLGLSTAMEAAKLAKLTPEQIDAEYKSALEKFNENTPDKLEDV